MTDPVTIALIGAASSFAMSLLAAIVGIANNVIGRRNQTEIVSTRVAAVETQATIVTLEKNTNSMKDALVKVTAESEFAKGLKLGVAASTGDPMALIAIDTDAQIKAAHEEGITKGIAAEKYRADKEKAEKEKPSNNNAK